MLSVNVKASPSFLDRKAVLKLHLTTSTFGQLSANLKPKAQKELKSFAEAPVTPQKHHQIDFSKPQQESKSMQNSFKQMFRESFA